MLTYEWLARTIFPGRDGDATLTAHLNYLDDEGWEIVQVLSRSPSGDGMCVVARRLRPGGHTMTLTEQWCRWQLALAYCDSFGEDHAQCQGIITYMYEFGIEFVSKEDGTMVLRPSTQETLL